MSGPSDHDLPPADRAAGDGAADGQVVAGRAASPRRDRMLSELAAELRAARDEHRRDITRLRTDLSGLSALVGDNADLLGRLIPRVNTLDADVAELADRLDTLFVRALATRGQDADDGRDGQGGGHGKDTGGDSEDTGGDGGDAATDWPSLSAAAAEREWQALGAWVAGVLGPFYELTRAQLPDCWPRHRPAVIELVWLRRTYVTAHTTGAAPAAAAADSATPARHRASAMICSRLP